MRTSQVRTLHGQQAGSTRPSVKDGQDSLGIEARAAPAQHTLSKPSYLGVAREQQDSRTVALAEPRATCEGDTKAKGGEQVATNPRRTNSTLRNKIRARVLREETHCWLCGNPVDVNMPHGHPSSPEVDEIIPVSKGGSPYDRKNCRLAHRICNQRRGNKDPNTVRYTTKLKTSRKWR